MNSLREVAVILDFAMISNHRPVSIFCYFCLLGHNVSTFVAQQISLLYLFIQICSFFLSPVSHSLIRRRRRRRHRWRPWRRRRRPFSCWWCMRWRLTGLEEDLFFLKSCKVWMLCFQKLFGGYCILVRVWEPPEKRAHSFIFAVNAHSSSRWMGGI